MKRRREQEPATLPEPPPMADYPIQRAYLGTRSLLTIFGTIVQATKGVFRPAPGDPRTWYGRLRRGIGLLCVWVVVAAVIAVAIQDFIGSLR